MLQTEQIDINLIKPDPNQPRKVFDDNHIKGLAKSIALEGIINPIELDQNNNIITGECRWRAAKRAGLKQVPVIRNPQDYSPYEKLRHQMAENVHQSGSTYDTMMNPIDTARGYATLINLKTGIDTRPGRVSHKSIYGVVLKLAEELGVSDDTIRDHLKLLDEPQFVVEDLLKGRPQTYYREANRAPDTVKPALQEKIAEGGYQSRAEVREDIILAKLDTEQALARIESRAEGKSVSTNKILNSVVALGLALERLPFEAVDIREKGIVLGQLNWIKGKVERYIEEASTTE